MRLLRIPLLALTLLVGLAGSVRSQGCDDVLITPEDTMRVLDFRGAPGDTVFMPFSLKSDSLTTGFFSIIQYDTSILMPLSDTNITTSPTSGLPETTIFIFANPVGRLVGNLNISTLSVNPFQQRQDIMFISYVPQFGQPGDTIPAGDGAILNIPMIVNPNTSHLEDTAFFDFFSEDIVLVDSSFGIPETTVIGCNTSQLNQAWFSDFLGEYFDVLVYPTVFAGNQRFVVDTFPPLPVFTFSASPTSISQGGSSTLSWEVLSGDSITIQSVGGSPLQSFFPLTGFVTVAPSVTTTYQAIAYRDTRVDTIEVTVTVGIGPPPDGPSILLNPAQSVFSVDPGLPVSVTVTATAVTGGTITLSASGVPNNGGFTPSNPITGSSPLVGTFSFTPDAGQSGQAFTVTFTASNSEGTATQQIVINVTLSQVDRLFSTSAPGQRPVGGLRGATEVLFPINLVANRDVYGLQFDMIYPWQFLTIDSFIATDRIPDYVIYEDLGDNLGRVRVLTFGLNNEAVLSDTTSAVLRAAITIDSSATEWSDYWIVFDSAFESIDPNPDVPSDTLRVDSGVVQVDRRGDVNLDRRINVADVVNIVGWIIQNVTLSPRQFATADLVTNDTVNVFDLVGDINLIFGDTVPVVPAPPVPGVTATLALAYPDMPNGGVATMALSSDLPAEVAGAQFEIAYDPALVSLGTPQLAPEVDDFILQFRDDGAGRLRMVMYTLDTDDGIQPGQLDLVSVPMTASGRVVKGDGMALRLSEALLSTGQAASIQVTGVEPNLPSSFVLNQNYPNPFNPTTTIEFTIGSGGMRDVKLEVFNVLGQRVNTLVDEPLGPGDYRVEWNATSSSGQRVATGVYLYRLAIGDETASKKMLFLK